MVVVMTGETKKRIKWIDLAKGICIVLVVLSHTSNVTEVNYPFAFKAMAFRMPLYFILSGLFFKQYEGFVGFIKRKTNKLLIPFLFFFIFTGVFPILLFYHGSFSDAIETHPIAFNGPLWFLLCLFFVNILFYSIQALARTQKSRSRVFLILTISLICGYIGLFLGWKHIRVPLYIDSALSAMPFFAFGWWLNRKTNFLSSPFRTKDLLIAVAFLIIMWITATPSEWYLNKFVSKKAFILLYLSGISGTMFILYISKAIGFLPFVSYWGRYSIIILCIHRPILRIVNYFSIFEGAVELITVFVITLLICHLLIPVFRRFLPHVTAQKDVIKIGQ